MRQLAAANGYTDDYGVWPFLVLILAGAALLYWNAPVARFIAHNLTGPTRHTPGRDQLQRVADSREWLMVLRVMLALFALALIVMAVGAMTGILPED